MKRAVLLGDLAAQINRIECSHPIRVAIDGPDAAGKTTLAEELVEFLQGLGRIVIRASIDGFHNARDIRYQRGPLSPEGYYYDSFDYQSLTQLLLSPLGPNGSRQYVSALFDYRTNSDVNRPIQCAAENSVLIFDGVFLLRPELVDYWDYSIFIDVNFETTLARAKQRDVALFGSVEEVRKRYESRYLPGQLLYFAESRPRERATVVIDNNDPANLFPLEL